jgi:hypothetical protein
MQNKNAQKNFRDHLGLPFENHTNFETTWVPKRKQEIFEIIPLFKNSYDVVELRMRIKMVYSMMWYEKQVAEKNNKIGR